MKSILKQKGFSMKTANHKDSPLNLEGYLKIALGQVQKQSQSFSSTQNARTYSYQILIELIKEQIKNETMSSSASQTR